MKGSGRRAEADPFRGGTQVESGIGHSIAGCVEMRQVASKTLYAHWSEVKRGAASPDRNDLDPSALGAILQDVFILGAEPGGPWRYRVAGTRLAGFADRELRDEPFERWWSAADRRDLGRMLESVVVEDAPLVGGAYGTSPDQLRYEFELVLLPLRHGGRAGLRMLGGFFPAVGTLRRQGLRIDEMGLVSLRNLERRGEGAVTFGKATAGTGDVAAERRRAFRVIEGGLSF